jgi:hypothetical protein
MTRRPFVIQTLCLPLICALLLQLVSFHLLANTLVDGNIVHDPVTEIKTGMRTSLMAEVSDESGVEVVRAYFKHESGANYLFINLMPTGSNQYRGDLPAASVANSTMEY